MSFHFRRRVFFPGPGTTRPNLNSVFHTHVLNLMTFTVRSATLNISVTCRGSPSSWLRRRPLAFTPQFMPVLRSKLPSGILRRNPGTSWSTCIAAGCHF